MSTPVLTFAATPTGNVKKPASITQKQFAALTAIEQIRQAFQPDGTSPRPRTLGSDDGVQNRATPDQSRLSDVLYLTTPRQL
jgi:hypothetical protein